MSSPPVLSRSACADGLCRLRFIRARRQFEGFLVLAASFSLFIAAALLLASPCAAQYPIRQIPRQWGPQPPVSPASGGPASAGLTGAAPYGPAPYGAVPTQPAQQAQTTTPHPAIARIVVPERDGISYGSGTLIDARGQFGLVVTNWHVVRDAAGPVSVQFADGFRSPAEVVKTDKDWDLAALSVHRPKAEPIPVTATAPQPGETLTIAGYGGGDYRLASGKCTQYLAPGVEFPHEMIELSTEARQGDSGGPILNERGELAGVLFGSGPGYTSGSYGGRVKQFLTSVVPGGNPGSDGAPPASAVAAQPPAAGVPGLPSTVPPNTIPGSNWAPPVQSQTDLSWLARGDQPPSAGVITPPPQATALHESTLSPAAPPDPATNVYRRDSASAGPPNMGEPGRSSLHDPAPLTPAQTSPHAGLLEVPGLGSRFEVGGLAETSEPAVDPKAEVNSDRLAANLTPSGSRPSLEDAPNVGRPAVPLPPRPGVAASGSSGLNIQQASSDQLLATLWARYGGTTVADQTKSVLAIVGFLSLIVVFLRINRHKEPEGDVD